MAAGPIGGGMLPTAAGSLGAIKGADAFGGVGNKGSLEDRVTALEARVTAVEQEEQKDENEGTEGEDESQGSGPSGS